MLAVLALAGTAALLMRGRGAPARATQAEPVPAPPDTDPSAADLLAEVLASVPTPGGFYQVQPDDTPISVALAALGEHATVDDAVDYLMCLASGPRYNLPLYATPSTSKAYPEAYMVPGKRLGVRVAFLPRNEDAGSSIRRGRRPAMQVDPRTGAPLAQSLHRSYGLLWLPPVDEHFSCSTFEWEDGSSAIDPPPDLLEKLT